jgi:hypothetical protein
MKTVNIKIQVWTIYNTMIADGTQKCQVYVRTALITTKKAVPSLYAMNIWNICKYPTESCQHETTTQHEMNEHKYTLT